MNRVRLSGQSSRAALAGRTLRLTRSCPSQGAWRKAETVDGGFLRYKCPPASTPPRSTHWLRLGKPPCAVKDFTSWEEESHSVVPSLRDRQAIWDPAVALAKLDGDGAVWALFRRGTVHRINIIRVRLEVALAVVDGERPETSDGDIPDRQLVNGHTVITGRRDRQV